jgi:hypothetical protein
VRRDRRLAVRPQHVDGPQRLALHAANQLAHRRRQDALLRARRVVLERVDALLALALLEQAAGQPSQRERTSQRTRPRGGERASCSSREIDAIDVDSDAIDVDSDAIDVDSDAIDVDSDAIGDKIDDTMITIR